MLLAVDVGNTSTVLGLFDGTTLRSHWRVATDRMRMADEYAVLLHNLLALDDQPPPHTAIISSVVPFVGPELAASLKRYWQIDTLAVTSELLAKLLSVETDNPREVGADRMVNAVASLSYDADALIVVDFGTATNFDLILKPNRLMGVALAPGPMTAADALFNKAAKLPRVDLVAPKTAVGKNTVTALQSGLVFGYASMVDGMVARFEREIDASFGRPFVIATGGFAHALDGLGCRIDEFAPMLTLYGLQIIAEKLG